jgi:predicted acyl esterase
VRWRKLNHDWYVSGRAYRDLDKIDGTPNPIFDEWLDHPSYDSYWQSMIPYGNQFARINIPVLVTAGYYYGGPGAAVYYYSQLENYAPKAEHYLLIGPYDHSGGQFGVVGLLGQVFGTVGNLPLDSVAIIDISDDIRYRWFDYVLKDGPRPALLTDRVNYEVPGANVWNHAPTLAAMTHSMLRFHLSADKTGHAYRLTRGQPAGEPFVELKIDLADRSDVDRAVPGGDVLGKEIDTHNGLEFISEPLSRTTEMSGLFSGQLDFVTNKKDFDFEIDLYELTAQGDYIQLAPYWTRASYVASRSDRHLVAPGGRQRLAFRAIRLMSRRVQAGSRIVAVISIIKEPGRQINYGTGRDVSDETVRDAGVPLDIKWYSDSYLDLPIGR